MHTIVTLLDTQWKAKLLDGFLSLKLHYIKKKVVGEFLNTIDQVVTK